MLYCCYRVVVFFFSSLLFFFFFQAEDGIRDLVRSRGLGDVYKRQLSHFSLEDVETVATLETRVNALEVDIDRELSTIIARRQPTARDLRLLMAFSKATANLERMGDEASKMARMVRSIIKLRKEFSFPSWSNSDLTSSRSFTFPSFWISSISWLLSWVAVMADGVGTKLWPEGGRSMGVSADRGPHPNPRSVLPSSATLL